MLIRLSLTATFFTVVCLFAEQSAQAALITSITPVASPGGTSAWGAPVSGAPLNDEAGGGNSVTGTVTFTLAGGTVAVDFDAVDTVPESPATEYLFTVTVTNSIFAPPGTRITDFAIELDDIVTFGPPGAPIDFDTVLGVPSNTPTPTPTPDLHTTTNLAWGPANGGPSTNIKAGHSRIFTFSLDVGRIVGGASGTPAFRLNFSNLASVVTVPEPTSLALAGFAVSGIGGLVIRRRRSLKKA